ncbi:MAG TPA: hypothetical protein VNT55_24530 [Baekduia sp.]|nr:hypothetical protein [Baekduia sp.]
MLLLFVIRQTVLTAMRVRDAVKTGDRSILQADTRPIVDALIRALDRIGTPGRSRQRVRRRRAG